METEEALKSQIETLRAQVQHLEQCVKEEEKRGEEIYSRLTKVQSIAHSLNENLLGARVCLISGDENKAADLARECLDKYHRTWADIGE